MCLRNAMRHKKNETKTLVCNKLKARHTKNDDRRAKKKNQIPFLFAKRASCRHKNSRSHCCWSGPKKRPRKEIRKPRRKETVTRRRICGVCAFSLWSVLKHSFGKCSIVWRDKIAAVIFLQPSIHRNVCHLTSSYKTKRRERQKIPLEKEKNLTHQTHTDE